MTADKYHFLSGGGEMGQLMRSKDWSASLVGTPETWPQSLRTTLSIILNSKFPMFLFWGPDLVCFYNDAYRPSLGIAGKHPDILGSRGEDCWKEIWPVIKPLIDQVLAGGEATWSEDQLIPIYRNGKMEDVYWTFSYSPVNDESGKPAGVFVTCNETTEKIITLKKLEDSKNQLEFAIDAVKLGTWDYDPAIKKFTANSRLKEWFGLPAEMEIELDHAINAIAEHDKHRVVAAIERALDYDSGGYYEEEYTIIQPHNQQEIVVLGKGRAWFNEDKIAYRFNGTLEEVTDQVIARRKISDDDKRFRNTVQQAPVGITILRGPEFIVEMANDAYLQLVDRKEANFVGRPLFDSLPEVQETVQPLLNDVLNTGIPFNGIEYPVPVNRYGKQEISYFNFLYHPLREEDGEISGIIVTVTDMTESVKAKHYITESEKQFRKMVMDSPIPMTIFRGKDFVIEIANKVMFEKIWRKNETGVLGKHLLDVFPELKNQKYPELLDAVLKTGKLYKEIESPVYVQGDDGMRDFYLDYEYAPLFEPDGSVSGILVTVNDVTEKVWARKRVEESEKEFRQLADSLPELVWTTDKAGNQTFASKRWKDFTGLDPYDAATFEKMVHPDDLQNIVSTWTGCLATGSIYRTQVRLKSKAGDYQWFYVHGAPIKDEKGQIEKWVGSFTNFNVQKRAEEELIKAVVQIEESESRFRDVANTVPVLIWMAGPDKLRNFFNTAWLNFTGRTVEQENGNGWVVSIHPDDLEKSMSIYTDAFEHRKDYGMEYRLRRHDGEYRWISAKGVPRFTASGSFEGFIGACMDIHEQVIYQQKLKEDEERLNIIIEASELGNWELDLETKQVTYSDRYIEILGHLKGEKLSHQEIVKHLHPDDLGIRDAAFKVAYETGMLHYESRIIWPDKSLHWIEGKGKVFYDDKGRPVKMIGTVRDITEEKNYQQQLKEREEKFRLLADSMPQHIWTADTAGNLNYFNRSVYDYSGLTPEQLNKDGWIQIVHPEEQEKNTEEWLRSVSTGKDFLFEHRFRRHDGEYRWQLSRAIPQRDGNGNIQMWVGTSTDIQQIKEQEQQKDFFISMASHELKTPITSIKGYVQLMQSTYGNNGDAFLKKSLEVVDKQVLTLTRLITDLLDVSKIKSGSLVLNKTAFEIADMIQEVVTQVQHINPDYHISVSGVEAIIHADRERISQVLINLLTNAVKYSPNSKEIIVSHLIEGDQVVVAVRDTGIGINKADQEKIFERFYRVEGKDERTYPGFGIGLFISSEIIQRHQGKIGVTSQPGKGSVFSFQIPLYK